jgi:hypothetical protein
LEHRECHRKGDLFGLGFKIVEFEVAENEIEKEQTGANELDRMTPAVTEILLADIAIESFGKEVIDATRAVVFAPRDMPAAHFHSGKETAIIAAVPIPPRTPDLRECAVRASVQVFLDTLFPAPKVVRYSCRTTLRRELLTRISPLYLMKPSFLNLFMKKFTRGRVVPIISASISCDTLGSTFWGWSDPP